MPILPEHKEILLTESGSKTLPEWVQFFDNQYTKNQIYSFCYHKGLKIKKLSQSEISKIQSNNARKYHINQDYFKSWSHNMAYILGLWFADGCIYGGKMFDITLHNKDKYILKKVAEELSYEGQLYDYVDRQAARINFSCVVIYNDIINLGGKENIISSEVNLSRFIVSLKDIDKVNKEAIIALGAKGIVELDNQLKIILGPNSKQLKKYIEEMK